MSRRIGPVFVPYDRIPGEDLTPRGEHARTREVWVNALAQLPELLGFGWANARQVRELESHHHADALEIVFMHSGIATYETEMGAVEVSGGQLIVFPPTAPHGGRHGALEPSFQHWLLLSLPTRLPKGYLGLPAKETRALHARLRSLKTGVYPASRDTRTLLSRITQVLKAPHSDLLTLQVRGLLLSLLIDVVTITEPQSVETPSTERPGTSSRAVKRCIALMNANLEQPLTIEALAKELGLSASHLKATFRQHVGVPPAEYYLRQRLQAAVAQIQTSNDPLAAVAHRYGFGSSQYFATCCRRILGRAPTEFRPTRRATASSSTSKSARR